MQLKKILLFLGAIILIFTYGCDQEELDTNYALNILVEGQGQTEPKPGVYFYSKDTIVELSAFPAQRWAHHTWKGVDQNPDSTTVSFQLSDNRTVTAVFREKYSHWTEDTTIITENFSWMYEAEFSRQGDKLATCRWEKVHIWNSDDWSLNTILEGLGWTSALSWSPSGDTIAGTINDMSYGNYEIWMWDVHTGDVIQKIKEPKFWVEDICFSPDGKKLVSSGGNMANDQGNVTIWDARTGQPDKKIIQTDAAIRSVDWSYDSKLIACGGTDNLIRIWDVANDHLIDSLQGHNYHVNKVRFSPNNKMLASTSMDNTVRLWNMETFNMQHIFNGHTSSTHGIGWSPDSEYLATGEGDEKAIVWDITRYKQLTTLTSQPGNVGSVAWSPDGKFLIQVFKDQHRYTAWEGNMR